jgi:hypothetical protein
MISLYLFAVLVGGGLLVFSLLGGHDGADDGGHSNPVEFLSIRTLTYFLFVFGGVGAILSWAGLSSVIVAALAAASGVAVGALVSMAFGFLRRTDSGAQEGEEGFVGLTARVTLPLAAGGLGKILVQRGGRSIELLARPLDPATGATAPEWRSVIVVEMSRGTALVAPLDDPLLEGSTTFVSQEKQ